MSWSPSAIDLIAEQAGGQRNTTNDSFGVPTGTLPSIMPSTKTRKTGSTTGLLAGYRARSQPLPPNATAKATLIATSFLW